MRFSARILGTHTATLLQARGDAAVLTIGRDRFTRGDLAQVSCFSYVAAANLSRLLADFGVTSTKDVYERISPAMLAVPHLGAISLAVLGAAFECQGLGGDAPLETWVRNHRAATDRRELVTFATIKDRAAETRAAKTESRAAQARTRGRRQQAHRVRVDRFTRRRAKAS